MPLSIPVLKPDADYIGAALAYASAGWYVLPLFPDTAPEHLRKRPRLGKGWPSMTSNDPEQIVAWFAGTDSMLGLHIGRSGALVFDVDYPGLLPPALATVLTDAVPYQSTREDRPGRGHWVFAQPEGRILGNSRGTLNETKWGEVRGANGIIVVQPTVHSLPGGRYLWVNTGPVPALPEEISALLPDFTGAADAVTHERVKAFLEEHTGASRPRSLRAVLQKFNENAVKGSRHEALTDALAWAMREAAMGFYPATEAMKGLWSDWSVLMRSEPNRYPKAEFQAAMAWAVGAALADAEKLETRKQEISDRLAESDYMPDFAVSAATTAGTEAPPDLTGKHSPRLPSDYFGKEGLDVALLAKDVLAQGELAWGRDESFWSYEDGVWTRRAKEVECRVVHLLKGRFRGSHATNAETVVRHQVGRINCDPTVDYINFANGMLDWRKGELVEHAPHFGSTVQLPLSWDTGAVCPRFDEFLASVLSEDYITLAWEMIGYLMMSGNPLQKAFLLLGTGANGKGTLIRVIEELLGRANIATQSLDALSNNRFAPVTLFGKIANLAGDIDATYQQSTAAFKMLTGEDPFPAEWKFGSSFTFSNWAVPVFSANRIPGSADTSEGYLRRWQVVEFEKIIPADQRIPGFSTLLSAELPGIAVKAVAALAAMMGRNHNRGGFFSSAEILSGADRFAESIDQVRQWINTAVVLSPQSEESQTDVYTTYRNWAELNGYGRLRSAEFFARLAAIEGVRVVKVKGRRIVRGITIIDVRLHAPAADFFEERSS